MQDLIINRDENDTTLDKIELAETLWESKFPDDFKQFLLKFNGGEVYPNIPTIKATTSSDFWELWNIERILSIDDIILQKKHLMGYTWHDQHELEDLKKYDVSTEFLLTFAVAERGCYYINLDKKQFGQIYYACYQDWDGFVRLETNSFTEFMNSLKKSDYWEFQGFNKSKKIYDSRYFYTPENPNLGLQRFKEVLSYLGDANSKSTDSDLTVIQYYAYFYGTEGNEMNSCLFTYLLENGGLLDGLLNRTRDINLIQDLIFNYGTDINTPYKERYPIIDYTDYSSGHSTKQNYYLIDKLLNLNIQVDFNVKDHEGKTALQRLEELVIEYEKWREHDKNFWKSRPEMHNFLTSEHINKLLKK